MVRMVLILMITAALFLAAPATQPFAASHVRPPEVSLGNQPTIAPGKSEWTPTVIAAWVQAIGSVLAIAAAVWIGNRAYRRSERILEETRRRDEAERHLKARSLAIALYPELLEMKWKIRAARRRSDLFRQGKLGIPPVLLQSIDRLYLLGEAGAAIQQFVATSRQFERLTEESRTDIAVLVGAKTRLTRHLDDMESTLAEAMGLCRPIHDGTD